MRRLGIALLALTLPAGAAAAADLPTKAPIYKAPVVAPLYSWTGLYVGVNVGGSWGSQDGTLVVGGVAQDSTTHPDGVIGGGQIGYNWQFNQWVLGLEADFQGSSQKGDGSFFIPGGGALLVIPPTNISFSDRLEWFGTVRGRLGVTGWAGDRWLAYITGGWAFGHGTVSGTSSGAITTAISGSHDYSGWTVGGGVEWAFYNNWSAKLEYLYIDFGDGPTTALTPTTSFVTGKMTDNIVRVGLNYKFF